MCFLRYGFLILGLDKIIIFVYYSNIHHRMKNLAKIKGFNWNKGNIEKSWVKHKVNFKECEEIFFNEPILIFPDKFHSQKEIRYYALGKTRNNRLLFVAFTIRNNKIRIISARNMSKKEKRKYEQQ